MGDILIPDTGESLNPREQEILGFIASGMSNEGIAQRLVISLNTVRWYNKHIYSKLGVHTRTLAIARAIALGLASNPAAESETKPLRLPVQTTPFIGRRQDIESIHK